MTLQFEYKHACLSYSSISSILLETFYSFFSILFVDVFRSFYTTGASTRENRSSGFPTRSDINRPVQLQTRASSLKFRI